MTSVSDSTTKSDEWGRFLWNHCVLLFTDAFIRSAHHNTCLWHSETRRVQKYAIVTLSCEAGPIASLQFYMVPPAVEGQTWWYDLSASLPKTAMSLVSVTSLPFRLMETTLYWSSSDSECPLCLVPSTIIHILNHVHTMSCPWLGEKSTFWHWQWHCEVFYWFSLHEL